MWWINPTFCLHLHDPRHCFCGTHSADNKSPWKLAIFALLGVRCISLSPLTFEGGRCSRSFTVSLVPFGSSRIRLYSPRTTPCRTVFHYAQPMVIPQRVWNMGMNAVRDPPHCREFSTSLAFTPPFRVRRCGGYHQQRRYTSRGNRLLHGVLRRPLTSLWGCLQAAAVSLGG
jgi:hypothetical protein